jgi:predicted PurR-regulated permease PerM
MNQLARYIIMLAGIALVGFLAWYFSNILIYILISGVLSLIGQPVVTFLSTIRIHNRQFPRAIAAAVMLIAFWGILLLFIFVMSPLITSLADQVSSINLDQVISDVGHLLDNTEAWIIKTIPGVNPKFSLRNVLTHEASKFINESTLINMFGSVTNMLISIGVGIFVVSFITFFFLKEEHLFTEGVLILFPQKYEDNARHALNSITKLLVRYFVGIFIDIFCVMTLLTVGLTLIGGLPFTTAIVLGFIGGILNMIPYVGPLVSMLFGTAIGLAINFSSGVETNLIIQIIKMVIVYVGTNSIDAVFFQPYIYSNSIKAHPLEIFLVIIIAGSIAGIFGMILAIPAYTVVRVLAKEFFNQFRVVQKLTGKM